MRAIIVLYILLGIIALVVILLHFSVRAYVKVNGDGVEVCVKYLFFTIFQIPENPNKKKKVKKNKKKKHMEVADTPLSEDEIDKLKNELAEISESHEEPPEEPVTEQLHQESVTQQLPPKPPEKQLTKAEIKEIRKKEKAEKKRLKAEEKANKPSLKEKINELKRKWLMIKPYVPITWKAVKKLLKTIRFRKTSITLGFGKEDPYESAINYGKMNIAVFDTLALLGNVFTMHYKQVKVCCLFNENKMTYDVETTVCVRPSTIIAIAFCTLVNFLKIFVSQKLKAKKERKAKLKEEKLKQKNKETECFENE